MEEAGTDNIIKIKDLVFEYRADEGNVRALDGVCLEIRRGSFTSIIGRNGSGKSTLAKSVNALLIPTEGAVIVGGYDTKEDEYVWEIRKMAGMVFQNPDNQLVSAVVEDDVAFGPENLGLPREEIKDRIRISLEAVDMYDHRKMAPHLLSGGQKQRVAIAGVVAMRPEIIIFDEPTAMLDPEGRSEVLEIAARLHSEGITVLLITHFMEETVRSDRVVILDRGRIRMDGRPGEVFARASEIRAIGLKLPYAVELAEVLRARGVLPPGGAILTDDELEFAIVEEAKRGGKAVETAASESNVGQEGEKGLPKRAAAGGNSARWSSSLAFSIQSSACKSKTRFAQTVGFALRQSSVKMRAPAEAGSITVRRGPSGLASAVVAAVDRAAEQAVESAVGDDSAAGGDSAAYGGRREVVIRVEHLTHIYNKGLAYETHAVDDVSFEIYAGEYAAVIGPTGSGKSTLIQHLNGLHKPTSGSITVGGVDVSAKNASAVQVRKKIGMVFQYPEYQLFEENVYKDIAFGPKNLGVSEEETDERVKEAMALVNMDFSEFALRSPFELSGGQKRMIAIAGVLAMRPEVLVLDEPTAGLDPRSHEEVLMLIEGIHERTGSAIIIVSHNMDDVARLADRVFVMAEGKMVKSGSPREVYSDAGFLKNIGLGVPWAAAFAGRLSRRGLALPAGILMQEELAEALSG